MPVQSTDRGDLPLKNTGPGRRRPPPGRAGQCRNPGPRRSLRNTLTVLPGGIIGSYEDEMEVMKTLGKGTGSFRYRPSVNGNSLSRPASSFNSSAIQLGTFKTSGTKRKHP